MRFDTEPSFVAHGVYSPDRTEALVSFAVIATSPSLTPPPLTLPGLDRDRRYRVEVIELPGDHRGPGRTRPGWMDHSTVMTGAALGSVGFQPPAMHPEHALLVSLTVVT
ncbi:MAG: GH36 C-terminal domain-containing protein [Ilumatobacteraceae bacterium]